MIEYVEQFFPGEAKQGRIVMQSTVGEAMHLSRRHRGLHHVWRG